MTLLITCIAAIISTLCWYTNPKREELKLSVLVFMFWGASLMWMCDAVAEFLELGVEFFNPSVGDMINDGFLGVSVVALGMIIWLIYLFIKDPQGIIKNAIRK